MILVEQLVKKKHNKMELLTPLHCIVFVEMLSLKRSSSKIKDSQKFDVHSSAAMASKCNKPLWSDLYCLIGIYICTISIFQLKPQ